MELVIDLNIDNKSSSYRNVITDFGYFRKITGESYQNIRFIRNTTKAEFSIKPCFTGVNDGLTITLKHNTLDGLDNAKKLLLSLINRMKDDFEVFKMNKGIPMDAVTVMAELNIAVCVECGFMSTSFSELEDHVTRDHGSPKQQAETPWGKSPTVSIDIGFNKTARTPEEGGDSGDGNYKLRWITQGSSGWSTDIKQSPYQPKAAAPARPTYSREEKPSVGYKRGASDEMTDIGANKRQKMSGFDYNGPISAAGKGVSKKSERDSTPPDPERMAAVRLSWEALLRRRNANLVSDQAADAMFRKLAAVVSKGKAALSSGRPRRLIDVHLLRHAESEFNAGRQNVYDPKLTKKGRQQAKKIGGHFNVVVCSTLTRAKETLALSKISYDQVIFSDLVREFKRAKCDFLKKEVKKKKVAKETEEELEKRMEKVMEHIKNLCGSSPSCRILVVGHLVFFKHMMKKYNFTGKGTKLGNGEMSKIALAI